MRILDFLCAGKDKDISDATNISLSCGPNFLEVFLHNKDYPEVELEDVPIIAYKLDGKVMKKIKEVYMKNKRRINE